MRLVMTLLARNEADIVDAQISFHLHAGVDFVIATDNGSDDGTTEILERYRDAGVLHLIHEPGRDMRQAEWVTRMARMAATDFGADWVINSDADEFWWPRGGTLGDVLSAVPVRYGVIRGVWRHFLPLAGSTEEPFSERMTVRLRTPAHPGDKRTIYHVHQKVAHRATPDVVLEPGNHKASGSGLEPLRTWFPIEVLHFSIRTVAQAVRKAAGGWVRNPDLHVVEHQTRLRDALRENRVDSFFRTLEVAESDLERGLADGTLVIDTRLRDVLRALRDPVGGHRLPGQRPSLRFVTPDVEDAAAWSSEVSTLAEIDAIVRAEERVAALERRLAALRTLPRR